MLWLPVIQVGFDPGQRIPGIPDKVSVAVIMVFLSKQSAPGFSGLVALCVIVDSVCEHAWLGITRVIAIGIIMVQASTEESGPALTDFCTLFIVMDDLPKKAFYRMNPAHAMRLPAVFAVHSVRIVT